MFKENTIVVITDKKSPYYKNIGRISRVDEYSAICYFVELPYPLHAHWFTRYEIKLASLKDRYLFKIKHEYVNV